MNEERLAASAQQARGAAEKAAGDFTGDAKWQAEGMADRAAGKAREALAEAGEPETPAGEVAQMRAEVDSIAAENAASEARAARQARRIDAEVEQRTEAVVSVVRNYPLITVGGAALAGFLLGRLMTGSTHIYRR
jgi:uncharacterized protein YjbJ (UPF0337 family)